MYLDHLNINHPFHQPFNHWKLYPRLRNHLRSESFFIYNDTYHRIQI
ncbi:hypothetical protein FWK35_00012037 [Aphis craccivora]|uniref:Uncharacterized protein n=1 Tax=Aphis craccivora TaxID=307492 RepID=A0A6G0YH54_APHCR|nr:hypothetical protein FWK35_00012037 [Aphis craccivora]